MLKTALFLLLSISIVSACQYTDESGITYIIDGPLLDWFTVTDEQGVDWKFTICPDVAADLENSPCPSYQSNPVAICSLTENGTIPQGVASAGQWSDAPNMDYQGVEILYGAPESNNKVSIQLLCGDDDTISIAHPDESLTMITVYTICPSWNSSMHSRRFPADFFIICLGSIAICLCCCCCCAARRRKCQKNKNLAMQNFSSVAFQPIPSTQSNNQINSIPIYQHSIQMPSYNPYLNGQQQQAYYYPQNVNMMNPFPIVSADIQNQQNQQEMNDLSYAVELQNQFDREARN